MFNEFIEAYSNNDLLCKLFVFDVPIETKEKEFEEAFSKFGEMKDVHVAKESGSSKTRTYGFVVFKNPLSALNALSSDIILSVTLSSTYEV